MSRVHVSTELFQWQPANATDMQQQNNASEQNRNSLLPKLILDVERRQEQAVFNSVWKATLASMNMSQSSQLRESSSGILTTLTAQTATLKITQDKLARSKYRL